VTRNLHKLTNELRRFIHSIASIPHLEAMLLMHQYPDKSWDSDAIARRLYLNQQRALQMLEDLHKSGICAPDPEKNGNFIYAPVINELNELIDQLAIFYASNLIEVTNMIHSRAQSDRLVHLFADAFKFNKEK